MKPYIKSILLAVPFIISVQLHAEDISVNDNSGSLPTVSSQPNITQTSRETSIAASGRLRMSRPSLNISLFELPFEVFPMPSVAHTPTDFSGGWTFVNNS